MIQLNDLYHYVGSDLSQSTTGDLLPVNGIVKGQQRILRRLMTNPREVLQDGTILPPDYIFEPDYGAGLPRKVGDVVNVDKIRALVTGQILMEDAVAKNPAPIVTVTEIFNGINIVIQYVDNITQAPATLNFNATA